jgi:hypothetical protein
MRIRALDLFPSTAAGEVISDRFLKSSYGRLSVSVLITDTLMTDYSPLGLHVHCEVVDHDEANLSVLL